jgi:hypothetical protein
VSGPFSAHRHLSFQRALSHITLAQGGAQNSVRAPRDRGGLLFLDPALSRPRSPSLDDSSRVGGRAAERGSQRSSGSDCSAGALTPGESGLVAGKTASDTLLSAMNPANDNSPLAHLRNTLIELLEGHAKTARDLLEAQRSRQIAFEKDLQDTVSRLETQRAANRSSPRGGLDFEDSALAAVRNRLGTGPYVCVKTGNVAGIRDTCRVGDFIVRFTDESAWAGASVVFECKHDASYNVDKAIKELDIARANRGASVGVFIMAQTHASANFPPFSRIGHNILVSWDPDDAGAIYRLDAAVMLAMALASRKQQVAEHASADAVRDIEHLLANQAAHVEKMRKASDGIRKNNEIIRKELDRAETELKDLVAKAHETLRALDLNAGSESAEREEPITFEASEKDSSKVA